jgi:hypothetical protein
VRAVAAWEVYQYPLEACDAECVYLCVLCEYAEYEGGTDEGTGGSVAFGLQVGDAVGKKGGGYVVSELMMLNDRWWW